MSLVTLRWADVESVRPYHCALVTVRPRVAPRPLPHAHADFWEVIWPLSGSGRHVVAARADELAPGRLVVVRPGDIHELAVDTRSLTIVNVAVPAETVEALGALTELDPVGLRQYDRPVVRTMRGDAAAGLDEAFRRILHRYETDVSASDVVSWWGELSRVLSRPEHPPAADAPPWLAVALDVLDDPDVLAGGTAVLAAHAGVTPGHLARTTRRLLGVSPTELIMERRLQRAVLLLTTTREPVTAVAELSGFHSPAYFSRRFSEAFGMAPREYRRQRQSPVLPG